MKTAVLIGAGSRGRLAYLRYLEPNGIKLIGVADPIKSNRDWVQEHYGVADDMCFESFTDMEPLGKLADIALICTNDRDHLVPFRMCTKQGYHILLEKPISPFPEEVAEVDTVAETYDKALMICHVLRYTSFFSKIKEIIDSGKIGKLMSINHNENMAHWFAATNYVRGKWNNSETTSPIILAKSCHDMDILTFLTGKKCLRVSSFGNTGYFTEENAPKGSGTRCVVDCKIADTCPYNALTIKSNPNPYKIKTNVASYDVEYIKNLTEDLKTSDFGRCVFRCDNNVCDHQVVAMEFEDNITAVFTLSAFTYDHSRTIKVMGTLGEIGGNFETGELELKIFGAHETEKFTVDISGSHGGGDEGIVKAFAQCVNGDGSSNKSSARECLHSHMIAFAAEESRKTGKVVDVEEYMNRFKQISK